jgi:DNA-binding Lrp family transcriptional regulator
MVKLEPIIDQFGFNIVHYAKLSYHFEMIPLDETDQALIAALRQDARKSVTELAAILDVTRTTVRTRLDRLQASGQITRFTIETNIPPEHAVRAVSFIALQGQITRGVSRALLKLPQVSEVHSTNGAWDLVVNLECTNLADFDQALRGLREIPGVSNSETCLLLTRIAG